MDSSQPATPAPRAHSALLLFAACLAVAWLLPNHYYPWSSFHQEAMVALAGAVLLVGVVASSPAVSWPRVAWVPMIVAIVPAAQRATGLIAFRSDALMPALYLAAFGTAIAAGATLARGRVRELLDALFGALLCAGIASTGLALCQWLGLTGLGVYLADMPPGGRPYANVGQPNHLATLLVLSVLALLLWFEQRRIGHIGLAVGGGWLLLGLALAQSRTSMIVAALLPVWAYAMRRRAGLRVRWPWLVFGVLALFGLVALMEALSELLLLPGGSLAGRLEGGTRVIHWRTLAAALAQSPLSGYGWNQVVVAQRAAAAAFPASHEVIEHSHNVVLDLLLWNGVLLGGALTVAGGVWMVSAARACRSAAQWIVVAAIGALLVHSLLEYPLEYFYILLPAGLLVGCASELRGDDGRTKASASRWTLALPAAALTAAGALVCVEYVRAEQAVRDIRFALAGYGSGIEDVPDLDARLLDGLREYYRYARTQARPGMSAEQLEWMRKVATRYPYPPSMLRMATALALNGHLQQASEELLLLCKLHPPRRCEEAATAWALLTQQNPQLAGVTTPFAR